LVEGVTMNKVNLEIRVWNATIRGAIDTAL